MVLIHKRDVDIIEMLKNYKLIKPDQLIRLFQDNTTKHRIAALLKTKVIVEENGFLRLADQGSIKCSYNDNKAFEVLVYFMQNFKDKVTYHIPEEYPFNLLFVLNGKLYDVAVIDPGQEELQCQLINRSHAERILAVVEDLDQARKIKRLINEKEVGFFTVDETSVNFYESC